MFKVSVFALLIIISLSSCSEKEKEKKIQLSGHTMGTSYHITLLAPSTLTKSNQLKLSKEIDGMLQVVNLRMSTYKSNSRISKFNQSTQLTWFKVPYSFLTVVKAAQSVSKFTQGAFDITVAPLVNVWGFGKDKKIKTPTDEQLNKILDKVGYQKLEYQENPPAIRKKHKALQIDLSAIAKGFAVDKVSNFLLKQNYKNFMVEIGGELRVNGKAPNGGKWRIMIRNPDLNNPDIKERLLYLNNNAVATSGNYLNYFIKDKVRYSHILDPRIGKPKTQKAMSVTVVHKSAMMADAYATALMVLGKKNGQLLADQIGLEVYWLKPH